MGMKPGGTTRIELTKRNMGGNGEDVERIGQPGRVGAESIESLQAPSLEILDPIEELTGGRVQNDCVGPIEMMETG
jgi:hypothetical protein